MTLDETLRRLEHITNFRPIRTAGGYMCLCPAHDDIGPSLSVSAAARGNFTLMYCFAGCNYKDVLAAISEGTCVNPWSPERAKRYNEPRRVVARYVYKNLKGKPVMRKVRFEPKSFMIQHFHKGYWRRGMNGVTPILYRLPEVAASPHVFILEGEKAVDKLREWGLTGTCSFNGASANEQQPKWLPELYNPYLENKHITILPDNDAAGQAHARYIMGTLPPVKSAKIINLPGLAPKADFYDWVEVGNTIRDLRRLWREI